MGALMLVRGIAHGAWCWSRITADLVARGHDVFAVDLPLMLVDGGDVYLKRMSEFPAAPINDEIELTEDGNFVVGVETAVGCFYNECDRGEAEDAARRLRPTAAACLAGSTGAEPWKSIPSTYVLCGRDRAIHPDFQRWMSTRAGEVVTLDTDHSPFMSSPGALADPLDGIADKASAGAGIT